MTTTRDVDLEAVLDLLETTNERIEHLEAEAKKHASRGERPAAVAKLIAANEARIENVERLLSQLSVKVAKLQKEPAPAARNRPESPEFVEVLRRLEAIKNAAVKVAREWKKGTAKSAQDAITALEKALEGKS